VTDRRTDGQAACTRASYSLVRIKTFGRQMFGPHALGVWATHRFRMQGLSTVGHAWWWGRHSPRAALCFANSYIVPFPRHSELYVGSGKFS